MNDKFSLLDLSIRESEQELELQKLIALVPAFTGKEATKAASARRRQAALNYDEFDRIYFPPEMYADGYAEPNAFHFRIVDACCESGKVVTLILGPNGCAKSVTIYKQDVWAALTGRRHCIVYASETLKTPSMIIRAIKLMLQTNKRIAFDFPDMKFVSESIEYLHVRTNDNAAGTVFVQASMDSSIRGMLVGIAQRPDLVHCTDVENRSSSMKETAVKERRDLVEEIRNALSPSGCVTIDANNFDERSLVNQYCRDFDSGRLDRKFVVLRFPAWGMYYDDRGAFCLDQNGTKEGPLWKSRFPARSIAELRSMMGTSSDEDWNGGQQQKPMKPKGDYFKAEHAIVYDNLPRDLVAVTYVDPSLAKKGRGDRTCLGAMLYSQSVQLFFAYGIRYLSYSESNDLLDDLRKLWQDLIRMKVTILSSAMDGNVNQESNWSQHVQNYCTIKRVMAPPIDYLHNNVELIAKIAQTYWADKKVRMPGVWHSDEERTYFENDLYAFTGRKLAGAKDDAPDWLCNIMHQMMTCGIDPGNAGILTLPHTYNRTGLMPFRGSKRC